MRCNESLTKIYVFLLNRDPWQKWQFRVSLESISGFPPISFFKSQSDPSAMESANHVKDWKIFRLEMRWIRPIDIIDYIGQPFSYRSSSREE